MTPHAAVIVLAFLTAYVNLIDAVRVKGMLWIRIQRIMSAFLCVLIGATFLIQENGGQIDPDTASGLMDWTVVALFLVMASEVVGRWTMKTPLWKLIDKRSVHE